MTILASGTDQFVRQAEPQLTDSYGVIVLNGTGTDVLLEQQAGSFRLPGVNIPRFARPAEQITSVLRDKWGISTVLLFSTVIGGSPEQCQYAVLEASARCQRLPAMLRWQPVEKAGCNLLDREEAELLQTCIARACQAYVGVDPAPFSRLGWIHRLHDWVGSTIQPLGSELTDVRQLNGSETFSLVRLGTGRRPFWFKAVGHPNLHEYSISLTLSHLFPGYVPKILASDPLLNGWLMESGGESTLGDTEDLETWLMAVQRLAQLQIESLQHTSQLLQAGCRDVRVETLASLVAPFFETMTRLMEQQTKTSPAPLTREELAELARTIRNALSLCIEIRLPDSLGHTDFNPWNALVDGKSCVFTDWAEAHVGHPLLTFEYLAAHLHKSCPSLMRHCDCLRKAYCQVWQAVVPLPRILRSLQLSPLIAVYAYASSGQSWRDPERLALPRVPAHLRSLTRRMKKEADSLRQGGICA